MGQEVPKMLVSAECEKKEEKLMGTPSTFSGPQFLLPKKKGFPPLGVLGAWPSAAAITTCGIA